MHLLTHSLVIFARGGGGGSSAGGGAGGIIFLPVVIVMAILAWWHRKQQIKKAKALVQVAEAKDPDWDENLILGRAKDVFYKYQSDWSKFDLESMKSYLTPTYLRHMALVLQAMRQLNRQNDVRNPKLLNATLLNVSDSAANDQDNFDVEIKGSADDCLIELGQNKLLWEDKKKFTEIWHFDRSGQAWLLDDIEQSEAESAIEKGYTPKAVKASQDNQAAKMESFAESHGFFYNADFGWLLLPDKGLLFGASAFGVSDINYHVIGLYKDVLVQLYQYVPFPNNSRRFKDYFSSIYKPYYQATQYTVAQTVLPKTYGDITIQHKSKYGIRFTPRGMKKVTLEWPDFNSRYTVFASDPDQVTSLELLNPAYMEKLFAAPFTVNIQITGNNLYLFSADQTASYDNMLALLQDAFSEMKM